MRLFVSPALCIPRHLTREEVPDEVREYVYDARERLIRVEDGNGANVARYGYNPFGHRMWKEVEGARTYFFYNESGLVGEYDASGKLVREYHYKPNQSWMTRPLFMRSDNQVYYYHNDHLGTPQKLISRSGQVVWEARYEAFGKADVTTEDVVNPLRFPGQYYDAETGLHHNYFRDYDPMIGRYIQSDPIGLLGGTNMFAYSLNNPVTRLDPLGLVSWNCRTFSAETGIASAGVTKIWFRCESECLCTDCGVGQRSTIEIEVIAAVAGGGRKYRAGTALLGSHDLEFETGTERIDSSVFSGGFVQIGFGFAGGIGYGASETSFGGGQVTGFNHGLTGGAGSAIGLVSGEASVVSEDFEVCDDC